MSGPDVLVVIPARYGSTRLEAKPLADICGRPMVQRVYEGAAKAKHVDRVVVATDDDRIGSAVKSFGGEFVMTSPKHATGTDRVSEAAERFPHPWIINLQGDLPLIHPEMLDELVDRCLMEERASMGTLKREITREEELLSPHVVKVVTNRQGWALYFSRSPIPHLRDVRAAGFIPPKTFYKHYGVYLYRRNYLFEFTRLPQGNLERLEKLEQLRAMEAGHSILVVETDRDSWEVDTPADLEKVREILSRGDRA
jgi:3-deoxy-manno-octulosonate cytidylyltransferase (CMP-KDO synthetase)